MPVPAIDVVAGLASAIRVLFGDAVADGMESRLGRDLSIQFIKTLTAYDHLSEQHPDSDPVMQALDDAAPRFDSFDDFLEFLQRMEHKLSMMHEAPAPEFHGLIKKMLGIVAKAPKPTEAAVTAGDHYGNARLQGRKLPALPLTQAAREALPYSYPSYDATRQIVANIWRDRGYAKRMHSELNGLTRNSINRLAEHLRHTEHVEIAPADIVVAAQQYLMSRNWIRYGLEGVAEASLFTAAAGYDHDVTVTGKILLSRECQAGFQFLGANLERVLRRVIFALQREVIGNTALAGRQPGIDLVIACASELVQDTARAWLTSLYGKVA